MTGRRKSMKEYRKVITKPGEVLNFETVFEENPYLRTGVPEKMGTVERFDYNTAVYENGKTYNKTAYVYLPYCYDKDDKSRKYNVLYFRHGYGDGAEQDKLGEELLNVDGVLTVSFNSNTMRTFTTMLDALSLVIIVIIASAGMLAFVVTYNLTNIKEFINIIKFNWCLNYIKILIFIFSILMI